MALLPTLNSTILDWICIWRTPWMNRILVFGGGHVGFCERIFAASRISLPLFFEGRGFTFLVL